MFILITSIRACRRRDAPYSQTSVCVVPVGISTVTPNLPTSIIPTKIA